MSRDRFRLLKIPERTRLRPLQTRPNRNCALFVNANKPAPAKLNVRHSPPIDIYLAVIAHHNEIGIFQLSDFVNSFDYALNPQRGMVKHIVDAVGKHARTMTETVYSGGCMTKRRGGNSLSSISRTKTQNRLRKDVCVPFR